MKLSVATATLALFAGACGSAHGAYSKQKGSCRPYRPYGGYYGSIEYDFNCCPTVAVANRASGTVSILDAVSGDVMKTLTLPEVKKDPEPMYVSAVGKWLCVGDRANEHVVVWNREENYKPHKLLPIGKGAFHQFPTQDGKFLWINNDIDNTMTVIDLESMVSIKTIPTPEDITDLGYIPHDLIISFDGRYAFQTFLGGGNAEGIISKWDTKTYQEVQRVTVGGDPHVGLSQRNNNLYVCQQGTNTLSVLDQDDLTKLVAANMTVPNVHGVLMSSGNENVQIVGNIGDGSLHTIDLETNEVIQTLTLPEDFPRTPHNIAGTGPKIFVTHSGPTNEWVSIYNLGADGLTHVKNVKVGLNPFGIDFVDSTCSLGDYGY